MTSVLLLIDTQNTITTSEIVLFQLVFYVPLIALMVWIMGGKHIRRWWRRRRLNIPDEETDVKTISGPTWEITWVKVSERPERHPDDMRTTVLGNTLPEVFAVLRAKYGDEFDEKNVRSTSKQSYTNVLVGIPETKGQ